MPSSRAKVRTSVAQTTCANVLQGLIMHTVAALLPAPLHTPLIRRVLRCQTLSQTHRQRAQHQCLRRSLPHLCQRKSSRHSLQHLQLSQPHRRRVPRAFLKLRRMALRRDLPLIKLRRTSRKRGRKGRRKNVWTGRRRRRILQRRLARLLSIHLQLNQNLAKKLQFLMKWSRHLLPMSWRVVSSHQQRTALGRALQLRDGCTSNHGLYSFASKHPQTRRKCATFSVENNQAYVKYPINHGLSLTTGYRSFVCHTQILNKVGARK